MATSRCLTTSGKSSGGTSSGARASSGCTKKPSNTRTPVPRGAGVFFLAQPAHQVELVQHRVVVVRVALPVAGHRAALDLRAPAQLRRRDAVELLALAAREVEARDLRRRLVLARGQ